MQGVIADLRHETLHVPFLQDIKKDFNNKFYIILIIPKHWDWLLQQKMLFGTSVFLYEKAALE